MDASTSFRVVPMSIPQDAPVLKLTFQYSGRSPFSRMGAMSTALMSADLASKLPPRKTDFLRRSKTSGGP